MKGTNPNLCVCQVSLVCLCQTLPAEILLFFTSLVRRKSTWKEIGRLSGQCQPQVFMFLSVRPLYISSIIFHTFSVFHTMYYMRWFLIGLYSFIIHSPRLSTSVAIHFSILNSFKVDKVEFSTLPGRMRNFTLSKHYPHLNITHCLAMQSIFAR